MAELSPIHQTLGLERDQQFRNMKLDSAHQPLLLNLLCIAYVLHELAVATRLTGLTSRSQNGKQPERQ